MSKNAVTPSPRESKQKVDARVRRTRNALGDALIALMQEKSFERITVQEVLDLAGVGRSTFYVHYRDKDDLFMSDADEFFETMSIALSVQDEESDRVAPAREFFAHVGEMHQLFVALVASGKVHDSMELARGHFARGIERRLAELPRGRGIPANQRGPISFAHSGTLLSLLTWWLDHDMRESPVVMDELFHRMVWTGINPASD
jgi:AcrR family transcriptional regulator